MVTAVKAFPYSKFLRGPSEVLPSLAAGDDVRLERRDEQALMLTRADRFEARSFGMAIVSRALSHLVKEDPEQAVGLLAAEMPWLRWLPDEERVECTQELVSDLAAGAETGTLEPFARSVRQWQHTAEVWSDPELAARLRSEFPGEGPKLERPLPGQ